MNKGLVSICRLQAGSRGGMFHSFCLPELPSHLPRASALSLVLRKKGDSSLLSRFGADPSISDAGESRTGSPTLSGKTPDCGNANRKGEKMRRHASERDKLVTI